MSRYFKSSYHGSNDYRKYRQEKLGKNDQVSATKNRLISRFDPPSHSQYNKNSAQGLSQTFGKQASYEPSRKQINYQKPFLNHRESSKVNSRQESSNEPYSFSTRRAFSKDLDSLHNQEEKSNIYSKARYGAAETHSPLTKQTKANIGIGSQEGQISSRFRQKYILNQTNLKQQKNQKESLPYDNFEDSIISRRRNYGDFETNQPTFTSKAYNYSTKLDKTEDKQFQGKKNQNFTQNFPARQSKFDQKYKSKYLLEEDAPKNLPYKSRNQMVKQRLNIKQDQQQISTYQGIRKQFNGSEVPERQFQSTKQATHSQIKTVQVTPQKSLLGPREDRNVSEQRRKSLIQKSQMLKQKLSKLNASSNTKAVQNQQNCSSTKFNRQKQNLTENYTPKRYLATSFQLNYQNTQKEDKDKEITKRLNFDQNHTQIDSLKDMNKNGTDARQPLRACSSNLMNRSQNSLGSRELQNLKSGQSTGEGALKKISELNERINSRLESILKNYG